jgi:hypothetical protein
VNEYSTATGKAAKIINRGVLNGYRLLDRIGVARMLPAEIAAANTTLLEAWHHPQIIRWLAYRRVLTLNRGYDQVLLADVKDVVFQAPPFDPVGRDEVMLFDQCEEYGPSYWDTSWYRKAWGEKALLAVLGKRPVCIGTMMGRHAGVLAMVEEICAFFCRHPFGRIEQAVFNHMLLTGQVRTPYRVVDNVDGPVATLSNDAAKALTAVADGRIVRSADGSVVPVVHMYDRFSDTRDLFSHLAGPSHPPPAADGSAIGAPVHVQRVAVP